jgi:DNA segregation ATPase FtsK/SpoIIIE, S-DNA-T family
MSALRRAPVHPLQEMRSTVIDFAFRHALRGVGIVLIAAVIFCAVALASWSVEDPSYSHSTRSVVRNWLGYRGAIVSDMFMQFSGLATIFLLMPLAVWGLALVRGFEIPFPKTRLIAWGVGSSAAAALASALPVMGRWPLSTGLGGAFGDGLLNLSRYVTGANGGFGLGVVGFLFFMIALLALTASCRMGIQEPEVKVSSPKKAQELEIQDDQEVDEPSFALLSVGALAHGFMMLKGAISRRWNRYQDNKIQKQTFDHVYAEDSFDPARALDLGAKTRVRREPALEGVAPLPVHTKRPVAVAPLSSTYEEEAPHAFNSARKGESTESIRVEPALAVLKTGKRLAKDSQPSFLETEDYQLPSLTLLGEPKRTGVAVVSDESLEQNATLLEGVLDDFGVRGEIINVRPGPVVTLYELEPAPGTKSSRVITLADDIARSMSAISARVAVVQGRNAMGIELPNAKRETVYLRELLASQDFETSKSKLGLCLGKTIGGEPVIADLAKMPHLLVAGTTGSGKSVAINTMILSLLYRHTPEQCRLIMVDPKMLELSVYDGIPHLLTPVVTDPKKAVIALKWAVREMEERYKKMSKVGVRNIDGYNTRMLEAKASGEVIMRDVQTGFDRETGEPIYTREEMDNEQLPYIVVIVDEMADLMMVAGKEIEGTIQRLAQMARAAGIHVILATQRPSVDVITGTIKANFPTRISFQVTSKIDSRTILGEMGAEQLLGQGDMLYMAGGGRITRVHGPFVSDQEVEKVVAHLKLQGRPQYLDSVTSEEEGEADAAADTAVFDQGSFGSPSGDLYDQAVAIVLRDKKASTSYIQRRLQVGYNKAASLMERMEKEGIVGPSNPTGKRDILVENPRDELEEMYGN